MMTIAAEDAYDATPEHPSGSAVLLLAGSSGRIESARADLLATLGARVRAIRWFGGRDQRPSPHEVPVELFVSELESLAADHDRVIIFGTSFGAEAALLVSSMVKTHATIAVSPSSVVWSGVDDGHWSSHWTVNGDPLPAVSFDPHWTPAVDPPEYRTLYESSLALDPDVTAAAAIPVERITGELLVTAGGDDRVWPSVRFATSIAERRRRFGQSTTVVSHPRAGHRLLLPGEAPASGGVRMQRGGSDDADSELGRRVWVEIERVLRPDAVR